MATEFKLIHQSEYAKKLRPFLPKEAFSVSQRKVNILIVNLLIICLGGVAAAHLDQWPGGYRWLFVPISIVMGNSVTTVFFAYHEIMHTKDVLNQHLMAALKLLGSSLPLMPPTLWITLHNKTHHNKTNAVDDPDRNYLSTQPKSWARQIQGLLVPSTDASVPAMAIGIIIVWLFYVVRNLTFVLLFNRARLSYLPASFAVRRQERQRIAWEILFILSLHVSVLFYFKFDPLKIGCGYIAPLLIGHGGAMFYIFTNHLISPMTNINDPLANSLSLRMPRWIDGLHLNFSYHAEHHIYPGMNSDYYPLVRKLLQEHYPERYHLLGPLEAWKLLVETPRNYLNNTTLVSWSGDVTVRCPLLQAEST